MTMVYYKIMTPICEQIQPFSTRFASVQSFYTKFETDLSWKYYNIEIIQQHQPRIRTLWSFIVFNTYSQWRSQDVLNLHPLAQNAGYATTYSPDFKSKLTAGSVPSWVNWIRLPFTSSLTYGNHRYNKNNVKKLN
jgi:hypothetical protein